MTRRELVSEQAARIAAEAPRNGRRPRLKRGPCDRCGAKIPRDSRYASHCAACRKGMYRRANILARRRWTLRKITAEGRDSYGSTYALPPRECGCRARGRHRFDCPTAKGRTETAPPCLSNGEVVAVGANKAACI